MAKRPVFVPATAGNELVQEIQIEFDWYPGFALSQKQKSIESLHQAALQQGVTGPILEISSKSPDELGVMLSAFNLSLAMEGRGKVSVESAFQGSKVFEGDMQYTELYDRSAREAKTDPRLKESGDLIAFRFAGEDWPLEPKTAFYDWLYLQALSENEELANQLLRYNAFTDIEFNPEKSINCQAHAAALYVALRQRGLLEAVSGEGERYLEVVRTADRRRSM